jgi:Ca2+-binding EF-hand superfamily protein
LIDAALWATGLHSAKMKDDVSKAFSKFDADGSGEIDREELG